MTSPSENLKELVKLTQTYLSQNDKNERWVLSSPELTNYFREFISKKKNKPEAPAKIFPTSTAISNPTLQEKTLPPVPSQKEKVEVKTAEPVIDLSSSIEKKASEIKTVSEEKQKSSILTRTPKPTTEPIDLSDIKNIVSERFPAQTIIQEIPDKEIDSRKKENFPPAIVILSSTQDQNETTFLHHLANALSVCIAPAKVVTASKVDQQNAWKKLIDSSSIKLILMNDHCLYSYPQLLQDYRVETESSKLFLGNKSLIILSNIQHYLTQVPLKRALWKSIKQYDL